MTTTSEEKSFMSRITKLDRRVMFWIMLILMLIPYFVPFSIPMTVSQYSRDFYNTIEDFSETDVFLVSVDCALGSQGELGGGWEALPKQLSRKKVKIVAVTTSPQGPLVFEQYMQPILEKAGYEYGVDFVNLGYAAGAEIMISRIAEDIRTVYQTDYYGTDIDDLPLMDDVIGANDFVAALTFDPGSTTAFYSRQWEAKYGTPVLGIPTAGNFMAIMPLILSGSVKAALNGARGCAEYEQLLNAPGYANRSINALSMGHLIVITFYILGNIAYFIERSKGGN